MKNFFTVTGDYSKRIYGLDIFRTVAIMIVVCSHGNFLLEKLPFNFYSLPLPDGVDLFFVLSGFLVGGIFIKIFTASPAFTWQSVWNFLKRRWFRTLPNYYLFLLVNLWLIYFQIIPGEINKYTISFFLFFQNFSIPFDFMFWESWSLSVEEWFYLLFPLSIAFFYFFYGNRISKMNILLAAISLFLLFPLIFRIYLAEKLTVDAAMFDLRFRKIVLTRLDMIMFGVFGAFLKNYHSQFWSKFKKGYFFGGLIIIFFLLFLNPSPDSFFLKTFYFSLLGFGILMLLPLADSISNFSSGSGKIISFLSIISYSMYLTNNLLAQLFQEFFLTGTAALNILSYFAYLTSVILVSFLVYKYFERPMMDLRDKFR